MRPLVSIIIPCHNAAPWLAATIASARAQVGCRVELIVVDDGSTDASLEIATRLAGADMLLLRQTNAGAAAARQRALDAAQGDFIQYLDADDLLLPDKLARQLSRLAEAPAQSIASGRWVRFADEPPALETALAALPEPNWRDLSPVDYLTLTFRTGGMMHPAAWLVPRAVSGLAGPWDTALSLDDDGEYFTRAVLASSAVVWCGDAVSLYRSNLAGSLSGRRSSAAWQSAFTVCDRSTSALLANLDNHATREACALYWLRLSFASYPDSPSISKEAERRACAFDPSVRMPSAGPLFDLAARALGWRTARRMRNWLKRGSRFMSGISASTFLAP